MPRHTLFHAENLLKSVSKLWIENGIYDGVGDAVHVTEPCRKKKSRGAKATVGFIQLNADRVHDIARENWETSRVKSRNVWRRDI